MDVDITILGPISMTLGGRPVPLGDRKRRTLFAILALERGLVGKSRLIQLLWPEEHAPKDPDGQLHTYVNHLRKALREVAPGSEKMLETLRNVGYQLQVEPYAVDCHRFRQLASQAKRALERDPARAAQDGRAALAAWGTPAGVRGGTPLEAVEPQLELITEGLRQEYQAALMTCLHAELKCGGHEQLLPELARLASYDEYGAENQELARIRMLATYRSGNRTEALKIYDHLRDRLQDSLAAEPDEETRKLRRRIMIDDPELQLPRTDDQVGDGEKPDGKENERPAGHVFNQTAETINIVDRMEAETINLGTFLENRRPR